MKLLDIDRSTTVEKVAMALRHAVFSGGLKPGEPLREISLAKQLGVARGTLREAVQVLMADGLLDKTPNRGVTVRRLTAAEVEDIFRARLLLELEAAKAAAVCPDSALEVLARAFAAYAAQATGDPAGIAAAHIAFHTALVGLVGIRRLADLERTLMGELQLVIANIDSSLDDRPIQIDRHRTICGHACARRVEELAKCLEYDLLRAKAFIIQQSEAQG